MRRVLPTERKRIPFTFVQGDNGGINASAWVAYYENDAITKQAPLFGSITTKHTGGNSYEITFNLTDDLGHTITGSWSGTFSELRELGMREPGGSADDGSVDDDFGDVTPGVVGRVTLTDVREGACQDMHPLFLSQRSFFFAE